MELQNLYSLDIFLQGFFLSLCFLSSLYILFQDNLEKFKNINSIHGFSDRLYQTFERVFSTFSLVQGAEGKQKLNFKYFGLIPVIIASSFIVGILGNATADSWVDSSPKYHFKLKPSLDDQWNNLNLKEQLRYKKFKEVFYQDAPSTDIVNQLYYNSKHEILKNPVYYNYFRKSQSMSEYSRVFALVFFTIFIASMLNVFLMIIRVPFEYFNVKDDTSQLNGKEALSVNENETDLKERYKRRFSPIQISNGVIIIFSMIAFVILFYFSPEVRIENNYLKSIAIGFKYLPCFLCIFNIIPIYKSLRFSLQPTRAF